MITGIHQIPMKPFRWKNGCLFWGISLSVYAVFYQWTFYRTLGAQSAYQDEKSKDNESFILNLKIEGMDTKILTDMGATLVNMPALPGACWPVLVNGTFDGDFALHARDLPLLSYAGSLLGRHGVHVWFTAGLASELDAKTANQIVPRARVTPMSQQRLCSALQHFHPDHIPFECDPSADLNNGHPPYSWPWCFPPTDPVHIMSIDCGIVDNYFSHPDVVFTLLSDQVVVSTDRGRWSVQSGVPVAEFQELAIMGAAEYATEPGKAPFHKRYKSFSIQISDPKQATFLMRT